MQLACSRLSDSGEDVKVKGMQKVGGAGKREKEGRACNHFFYDPLPPTFGTFDIIRFQNAACCNGFFLFQVDYALEWSTF